MHLLPKLVLIVATFLSQTFALPLRLVPDQSLSVREDARVVELLGRSPIPEPQYRGSQSSSTPQQHQHHLPPNPIAGLPNVLFVADVNRPPPEPLPMNSPQKVQAWKAEEDRLAVLLDPLLSTGNDNPRPRYLGTPHPGMTQPSPEQPRNQGASRQSSLSNPGQRMSRPSYPVRRGPPQPPVPSNSQPQNVGRFPNPGSSRQTALAGSSSRGPGNSKPRPDVPVIPVPPIVVKPANPHQPNLVIQPATLVATNPPGGSSRTRGG